MPWNITDSAMQFHAVVCVMQQFWQPDKDISFLMSRNFEPLLQNLM